MVSHPTGFRKKRRIRKRRSELTHGYVMFSSSVKVFGSENAWNSYFNVSIFSNKNVCRIITNQATLVHVIFDPYKVLKLVHFRYVTYNVST